MTGPSVRIREARARDALELVRLRREVLAEDRWFISTPDEALLDVDAETDRIEHLGVQSNAGLWVARQDRVLLGMLVLEPPPFRRTRHVVKLELMVAASARGQGVGRALLEHGQGWVRDHGVVQKIGLNVFADNTPALALYTRCGFVEEGRRHGEYRMDDGTLRDDLLLCWTP